MLMLSRKMPGSLAIFIGMELFCSLLFISFKANCSMSIVFILMLYLFIGVLLNAIAKACLLRRAGAQVSGCNDQLQVQNSANDNQVTGEWSELADDVLRLITNKLHFMEDYVRFGAVCRSWHQIFLQKEKSSNSNLPWLMLRDEVNDSMFRFYTLFNGKVYTKLLPEIRGMWCWGSNHGWLVTCGKVGCIMLLNPLSGDQISLPTIQIHSSKQQKSISYYRFRSVYKIVLSSSPRAADVVIMAIYSPQWRLALLKPGNNSWTPIRSVTDAVADIAYYGNKFFAIDAMGQVLVFSGTGEHIHTLVAAEFPDVTFWGKHIVEFGGKIYIVLKYYTSVVLDGFQSRQVLNILVLELDEADQILKRVYDLGEWTVFLQFNYSFGMYALDYPEIRKNCVYFVELNVADGRNPNQLGIYRLEDNLVEWHPLNIRRTSFLSRPFWTIPSLY